MSSPSPDASERPDVNASSGGGTILCWKSGIVASVFTILAGTTIRAFVLIAEVGRPFLG